jgi:hypothetical protein
MWKREEQSRSADVEAFVGRGQKNIVGHVSAVSWRSWDDPHYVTAHWPQLLGVGCSIGKPPPHLPKHREGCEPFLPPRGSSPYTGRAMALS